MSLWTHDSRMSPLSIVPSLATAKLPVYMGTDGASDSFWGSGAQIPALPGRRISGANLRHESKQHSYCVYPVHMFEWLCRKANDPKTICELYYVWWRHTGHRAVYDLSSLVSIFVEGLRTGAIKITNTDKTQMINWISIKPLAELRRTEWAVAISRVPKIPPCYHKIGARQPNLRWQEVSITDNQILAHTKYNYTYHIVFIPKYCRKVMYGKVGKEVGEILSTIHNDVRPTSEIQG